MDTRLHEHFRGIILQRIETIGLALVEGKEDTRAVSPDAAIGRLSRLDAMQMQQMALASRRRLEEENQRLQEALRRIQAGTYGTCLLCQQDISQERLEYQPDAVSCVPCLTRKKR